RLGAVQQLTKLSKGKNLELARAAREALEKIAAEDDSHRVVEASAQALESLLQEERGTREAVRKARHEALRLAAEQEAVRLKAAPEKTYGEEKKITPVSPPLLDPRQRR